MKDYFIRLNQWVRNLVRNLCRMLILGVSIAGLILLLADAVMKFFTSSEFTVDEITISGNKRVDVNDILAQMAIAPGENIWLVNLEDLGKRLEKHPAIRHAGVRRFPPKRIHISIEEREFIAFFMNDDGSLLGLDPEGVVLPPPIGFNASASPDEISDADIEALLSYPVLRGEVSFPKTFGERTSNLKMQIILLFLKQLQAESPLFFKEIVEGEMRKDGNFLLHLRRRIGVLVLRDMTKPDLIKKIDAFWQTMEKEGLRAVYVDGRFPEKGFAVRADAQQNDQWEQLYRMDEAS